MNTLDLDSEWGAIDLLEEVEASFGITLEDAVVKRVEIVGDLYDAICNLTPYWDTLPVGLETLEDLVTLAVPLNAQVLAEIGGRLSDRWTMLTGLAAEHDILSPAEIHPDTYLHLKSLKFASKSA